MDAEALIKQVMETGEIEPPSSAPDAAAPGFFVFVLANGKVKEVRVARSADEQAEEFEDVCSVYLVHPENRQYVGLLNIGEDHAIQCFPPLEGSAEGEFDASEQDSDWDDEEREFTYDDVPGLPPAGSI